MTLEQQCINRVNECFDIAERALGVTLKRCPVVFSSKMTRAGGTARYKRDGSPVKITLSSPLLKLNGQTFIDRTPGHEVAHIIANQLHGGNVGHGAEWAKIMVILGQNPERTHCMDVPKGNSVECVCDCTTHLVTKIIVNRMAMGVRYTCKLCRADLKPKT